MKKVVQSVAFILVAGFAIIGCSSDDSGSSSNVTKSQVIENYTKIVSANYQQAYDDAVALETAVTDFTANPTDANFTTAKAKWKAARESYGTTEAFRFSNGPIDDENGPEGLINSWPLDENYIDYVQGNANAGIINATATYPTIDKALLISLNENGGEKNISTGYHAIEFLLWGQDLTAPSANLPGQRPYTDFVDGGTAANQNRRRDYLKACADLLTDNLQYLVDQWKEGGAYRATFLALPKDTAIQNMFLGITTLVQAELAVERMDVALGNADQEDEHSCFSDNTHRDIAQNLQGAINVYTGKYGNIDGPSLEDLVKQANETYYTNTQTSMTAAHDKIAAIMIPFDLAISGGVDSVEGAKVRVAVLQLKDLGANWIACADALGISITII